MSAERIERVTETTVSDPAATPTHTNDDNVSGSHLAARIIKFVTGFIVTLLVIRFLLILLGANRNSGFVDFIVDITSPLVSPFAGIFDNPVDTVRFEPQTLTAIIVYTLVGAGLAYLVRIRQSRTAA